ncbi:uncharacterized protein LOC129565314 isoform X2 [Sitodiplosis mosellana]|uniref:uncharacterized protein LOC129565314 isoform X2 n=1 Tax=Sitodiplosis mosellana TaxID=263140 RepID=UPI0024448E0C|nr:uncharacterized protein LOC129565314 isoform X2 [Sitodiplosis mosellana]
MSSDAPGRILTRRQSKLSQQVQSSELPKTPRKSKRGNTLARSTMSTNQRQIYSDAIVGINEQVIDTDQLNNMNSFNLEDTLSMLEMEWSSFRNEHSNVVGSITNADQLAQQAAEYKKVSKLYLTSRSAIRARLEAIKPKVPTEQMDVSKIQVTVKQKENVDIPITWGHFEDDCLEWPIFRDGFKFIHEDPEMPPARKFYHLQRSLRGEAARIRGKLGMTDTNYQIVWDRLVERYEDDYLIVNTLITKMLTMKPLQKASSHALRCILDTMRDCLGRLEDYFDTKTWGPMLVCKVLGVLDKETKKEWEKLRPTLKEEDEATEAAVGQEIGEQAKRKNCIPSWKQLEQFLEKQAKFLGHAESSNNAGNASCQSSRDTSASRNTAHHQRSQASGYEHQRSQASGYEHQRPQAGGHDRAPKRNAQSGQKAEPRMAPDGSCLLCRGPHYIYKCDKWLNEMNLIGRQEFMRANNLCPSCLRPNHGENDCFPPKRNRPCPQCPERRFHNSTLCPTGDKFRNAAINQASAGPSKGKSEA